MFGLKQLDALTSAASYALKIAGKKGIDITSEWEEFLRHFSGLAKKCGEKMEAADNDRDDRDDLEADLAMMNLYGSPGDDIDPDTSDTVDGLYSGAPEFANFADDDRDRKKWTINKRGF